MSILASNAFEKHLHSFPSWVPTRKSITDTWPHCAAWWSVVAPLRSRERKTSGFSLHKCESCSSLPSATSWKTICKNEKQINKHFFLGGHFLHFYTAYTNGEGISAGQSGPPPGSGQPGIGHCHPPKIDCEVNNLQSLCPSPSKISAGYSTENNPAIQNLKCRKFYLSGANVETLGK